MVSINSVGDETSCRNLCLEAQGSSLKALTKRILGDWKWFDAGLWFLSAKNIGWYL